MIKRRFFLLLFCVGFITLSNAQINRYKDHSIVYLKNGSVFIGEIIDEGLDHIEMDLSIGEKVTFSKARVSKYIPSNRILIHDDGKYHITGGTFFDLSIGFNAANFFGADTASVSSHINFIYGFNFTPRLGLGAGLGFEFNRSEIAGFTIDTQFAPVFLYSKYYLLNHKKRLYLYGRLGYGFKGEDGEFETDHEGGVQYQGGIGVHFPSKKNVKIHLTLGYHLQKTNGRESFLDPFGNEIRTQYDIWIRRTIFNFKLEWNWAKKKFH